MMKIKKTKNFSDINTSEIEPNIAQVITEDFE